MQSDQEGWKYPRSLGREYLSMRGHEETWSAAICATVEETVIRSASETYDAMDGFEQHNRDDRDGFVYHDCLCGV